MKTVIRPGHEALVLQPTDSIFKVYTSHLGEYGTAKLVSCIRNKNKVVWHHFIEQPDGFIGIRIVGECEVKEFIHELRIINKNLYHDYQKKLKPARPVLYSPHNGVDLTRQCLKQFIYHE